MALIIRVRLVFGFVQTKQLKHNTALLFIYENHILTRTEILDMVYVLT